jgi:hypothetical protein
LKEKKKQVHDQTSSSQLYGLEDTSFGAGSTVAEFDGMIVVVGGSESMPGDAETRKVNPELLLEDNAHL